MDPNTGVFHELDEKEGKVGVRGLIGRMFARAAVKNAVKKPILHPAHRELVIKATRKPVPKNWPIFTVGESYDVFGRRMEIAQITQKDIWLRGECLGIERGSRCVLQGREFRVRFTDGHFTVVRPIVGRVVPS